MINNNFHIKCKIATISAKELCIKNLFKYTRKKKEKEKKKKKKKTKTTV